jgi:hypothetical protein
MAVDLTRTPARALGYGPAEARGLARELGGTAVPAKWLPSRGAWEIGGWSRPGAPHIVVLPFLTGKGGASYVVLADNTAPVKTAEEALAEFE